MAAIKQTPPAMPTPRPTLAPVERLLPLPPLPPPPLLLLLPLLVFPPEPPEPPEPAPVLVGPAPAPLGELFDEPLLEPCVLLLPPEVLVPLPPSTFEDGATFVGVDGMGGRDPFGKTAEPWLAAGVAVASY